MIDLRNNLYKFAYPYAGNRREISYPKKSQNLSELGRENQPNKSWWDKVLRGVKSFAGYALQHQGTPSTLGTPISSDIQSRAMALPLQRAFGSTTENKALKQLQRAQRVAKNPQNSEEIYEHVRQNQNTNSPVQFGASGAINPILGETGKSERADWDVSIAQKARQGVPISSSAIQAGLKSINAQVNEAKQNLAKIDPKNVLGIQAQQKLIQDLEKRQQDYQQDVVPLLNSAANRRALRARPDQAVSFGNEDEIQYLNQNRPASQIVQRQQQLTRDFTNSQKGYGTASQAIQQAQARLKENPNDYEAGNILRQNLAQISTNQADQNKRQYLKSMGQISLAERNDIKKQQQQAQAVHAEDERLGLAGRAWTAGDIDKALKSGYTNAQIAEAMRNVESDFRPDVQAKLKELRSKQDIGAKYQQANQNKSVPATLKNL